jgi:hypothetical protein
VIKVWTHGYMVLQATCVTDTCCQGLSGKPCEFVPDTDSVIIGLDTHATCCMDNNVHDFVTKLTPTPNIRVRGLDNQPMPAKGRGAVLWKIEDDDGVVHNLLFTGTFYIPELKMCMMLTQSWCQRANTNFPKRDGTWQYQMADSFVIEWNQRKFRRTVPWDRRTNKGAFVQHYCVFDASHNIYQECHKHEHIYYMVHVILDDHTETSSNYSQADRGQAQSLEGEGDDEPPPPRVYQTGEVNLTDFFTEEQAPTIILDDESDRLAAASFQEELLRFHYSLGQTSYTKLKLMTALGILSRKLSTVHPPKCACCIFGAMTKKSKRNKAAPSKVKTVVVRGPD